MHIIRFSIEGKTKYGIVEKDTVRGYQGDPFSPSGSASFKPDGTTFKLSEVKLLAPCLPSKIIGLGLNYLAHVIEAKFEVPKVPLLFLKPPTALIGPGDNIVLPPEPRKVEYEGELAIVIGKTARKVPENKAADYILGYTCFNDVSERHAQQGDKQWTRGKGYDTFAPAGPGIETGISPGNLKIETYVNGVLKQKGNTNDLIFNVPTLVSFISHVMTLLPGDVIATGTPFGTGQINPGDAVEIKIENIGTLKNSVVEST
jgi:2-keto-4-pentenoate hydratase/2-oxohepta-3-ene-1,7-dioic acid hydratase in catechol pathway